MKVIKKGKQVNWEQEFTCLGRGSQVGCGAILLVTQDDLYRTCSNYMDGSCDYYTTFCCMECGVETDVEVKVEPLGRRPGEERIMLIKKRHHNTSKK